MRRSRLALVAVAVLLGLLWAPVVRPTLQAAVLVAHLFSPALVGTNFATWVTPAPRVREERAAFAGAEMRVTWWRPAWGDAHPGIMVVNGATQVGNENTATRELGAALARAGYLVMLPEFAFLKDARFDPASSGQLEAAFAHLRGRDETRGEAVGAFGTSVGGGLLLSAAGREPALSGADYLVVLGAYFDMDTYLASLASEEQQLGGRVVPWRPDREVTERLPAAARAAVPAEERSALINAMAPRSFEEALGLLRALPPASREALVAVSPRSVWARIAPPVYWIHDPDDAFEPLAEAEAAAAAPRAGRFSLMAPQLVSHAVPSARAKAQGPLFVVGELWALITYTVGILRVAG